MTKQDMLEQYNEDFVNDFCKHDNKLYHFANNQTEMKIADKLIDIKGSLNFWEKVRHLTKGVASDRNLASWLRLAELRELQLLQQGR